MSRVTIEVTAEYHERRDKWTGLCIERGKIGTHKNYNVVYNGVCSNEYVDSKSIALQKAKDSLFNLN